jgi:hypothetical protein
MTTWTIKSEIDDPKRPLEVVEDQRNRGYKVWIEDENGRGVDDESLKKNDVQKTNHALYETGIGVLIWGAAAAIAIGGLYACSLLAGD